MLKQAKQMKSRFKTKNKTFFPKPSMGHRNSSLQRETLPPTPQPPPLAYSILSFFCTPFVLFIFSSVFF